MNLKLPLLPALVCSIVLVQPGQGGESAKDSIEFVPPAPPIPECSDQELRPLYSQYAQTTTRWTLRAGARFFRDATLQEADQFDGTTLDLELIAPLNECMQLRVYFPYYTDGDAREFETGDKLDIEGNGGALDFPTVIFDYQFAKATSPGEFNLAAFFGIGDVRQHLEATNRNTGTVDRFNHHGSMLTAGVKADKQLNRCWRFIGNLGARVYRDSDDMNPSGGSDKFFLIDVSTAFIYAPRSARFYPMIEGVYQGDFTDYNSLQIVPQLLVPLGSHLDLNAGVSLGLIDGPSTEGRLLMTLRF